MRSLNIAAQNSGKWTPPTRTRSSLSTASSSSTPSWRAAAKSPTAKSPTSPTTQDEEPEFSLSELVSSEKSSSTNSNALHESSFQLFESKTEIEYLDDQDDLAARIYGDRGKPSSSKSSSNDSSSALGTSGYNFDSLLS